MIGYEYKVVPAPTKGRKAPGVKGAEARFANAIEHQINEWAADGWEYLRADILPSEERQGLTSTQTVYRTLLVFRRLIEASTAVEEITEAPIEEMETDAASEDPVAEDDTATEDESVDEESDTENLDDIREEDESAKAKS